MARRTVLNADLLHEVLNHKGQQVSKSEVKKITTKGGLEINLSQIREALDKLVLKTDTLLSDLDPSDKDDFKSIESICRNLRGDSTYDIILTEILTVFASCTKVRPGTVGAYFKGCFLDNNLPSDISPSCSQNCIGSLQPNVGTPGYTECENLIVSINANNELVFENMDQVVSRHQAIIYIIKDDTDTLERKLTFEHLNRLRELDVSQAKIVVGDSSGYQQFSNDYISIETLYSTVKSGLLETESDSLEVESSDSSDTKSNLALWIIIIVVIVLLVLLFLFFSQMPSGGIGSGMTSSMSGMSGSGY